MTSPLFVRAVHAASVAHAEQKRESDGLPYDRHCFEVSRILSEHGIIDPTILSAAVLHDAVEITEMTLDAIGDQFGPVVELLVCEVSNDGELTRGAKKYAQMRKVHEGLISEQAVWIKIADAISNCNDIASAD